MAEIWKNLQGTVSGKKSNKKELRRVSSTLKDIVEENYDSKSMTSSHGKSGEKKKLKRETQSSPSLLKDYTDASTGGASRSSRVYAFGQNKTGTTELGFRQRKIQQRVRSDDPYYRARPIARFLADAEKEYLEVTRKDAAPEERVLDAYRRLAAACRYADRDHAGQLLTYHPSCTPGDRFLQYLVPFSEEAKGHMQHIRKLEVWFPDTIFCSEGQNRWFYSNEQGQLDVTEEFPEKSVIEKLGDFRFEHELTALMKKVQVLILPGKGRIQHTRGNVTTLCSTVDLRVLAAEMFSTGSEDGTSLQKYVKSKGPFAFIHRAVLELRQPPFAWMITNKAMYSDAAKDGADLNLCTLVQPSKDHSTTITKIPCSACTDVTDLTQKLWGHIESMLQRRLELLVADYTRDDEGRWWFLQVKAFRFKGVEPDLPLKIPLVFRRALKGLPPPDSDEEAEDKKSVYEVNKKIKKNGAYQLKSNIPPTCTRRLAQCKSCQGWHENEDLPFQMTAKMIRTTVLHLKRRLPPDKCPKAFQGGLENLITLNRVEKRLPGQGGMSYQHFRVCQLCFELYQQESKVMELEERIARMMNSVIDREEEGRRQKQNEGTDAVNALAKLEQVQRWGYELPEWLHCTPVVDKKQVPSGLTLCRVLIALQQLLDVPRKILPTLSSNKRLTMRVVYTFLGTSHVASLQAKALESKTDQAISEETVGSYDDLAMPPLLPNIINKDLVSIPIHLLRMHYFFAPKTPLEDPLPHDSGLADFIMQQKQIDIGLLLDTSTKKTNHGFTQNLQTSSKRYMGRASEYVQGHEKERRSVTRCHSDQEFLEYLQQREQGWLGNAHLPLAQFRNDYVKRLDLLVPLSVDIEGDEGHAAVCTLQASLGVERIRSSLDEMTIPFPLMKHRGIYLATDHTQYPMSDPLPDEWMSLVPLLSGTVVEDPSGFDPAEINSKRSFLRRQYSTLSEKEKIAGFEQSCQSSELANAVWCVCIALQECHHLPYCSIAKDDWGIRYKFLDQDCYGEPTDPEEDLKFEHGTSRHSVYFKCQHRFFFKGPLSILKEFLQTLEPITASIGAKRTLFHAETMQAMDLSAREASGSNFTLNEAADDDSWNLESQEKKYNVDNFSPAPSLSINPQSSFATVPPHIIAKIDISELGDLKNIEGIFTVTSQDGSFQELASHEFPTYLKANIFLYQAGPPEDDAESQKEWVPPRASVAGEIYPGLVLLLERRH